MIITDWLFYVIHSHLLSCLRAPVIEFREFVAYEPDPKCSFGVEGLSLPPTQVLVVLVILVGVLAFS